MKWSVSVLVLGCVRAMSICFASCEGEKVGPSVYWRPPSARETGCVAGGEMKPEAFHTRLVLCFLFL